MLVLHIGLLLLGLASAEEWIVSLDSEPLEIHIGQVIPVAFNITLPNDAETSKMEFKVVNSDKNIINVTEPSLKFISHGGTWSSNLNITGIFLGKADISLELDYDGETFLSKELRITVIRPERIVDKLFTISIAALVFILYINFGCAMDWSVCRKIAKKPVGPLIGSFCQFIIMPLLAFGIGQALFPDKPEMQIGIFFTGISPSGGASNIWTVLLGGNLPLSIGMTTISTLGAFGTIPFWIFTLGKYIFDKGNLKIPYTNIAILAFSLIVPLSIGYLIQKKVPKLSQLLTRIMKPFSIILILFIAIFAIVTNLYLFKLFSWQIIIAGMALPWIGFLCGLVITTIFQQPRGDVRALAIETGIQNTGIAIFLLRFSLPQPAADLTTVIPVSCAIMTPLPLAILWCLRILNKRRKTKKAGSSEKLDTETLPATTSNLSTITT
ncbi:sodium/bile acid cotransporter [Chelonus insularis]|uniref:sodium/bile acid cotransporter n=1 Tax=Chelonus insularis TaxID=460826 RepID=UPI00158CA95E|nr:sodium/bile acid cotransporter [Chelonus insularis]XP_034949304.1 sodium/bile acid cotransporter [Chelonus insularis]XP_034949305.1 sodium/bile acid cotransporter [Chelonus insularis]